MLHSPYAVAFSPDGKTLAAGSFGDAIHDVVDPIKLWDVASRRALASGIGSLTLDLLQFSPDGKTLITRGFSGTLTLCDVAGNGMMALPVANAPSASSMALSLDWKTLAIASEHTVRLWNLAVGQEVATLKGHSTIHAIAFSPDGSTLATASGDGTVCLWPAVSVQEADPLQFVYGGGGDHRVTLWWRPLPSAVGYNVFRRAGVGSSVLGLREGRAEHRTPNTDHQAGFVKLTPQPVTGSSFTDQSPSLVNDRPQTYAVAPVYRGGGKKEPERPRVLQVTPVPAPPGWLGCSINEGARTGSVVFHPLRAEILVRGSGHDIWQRADGFYFLCQPLEGDSRITVRALTPPAATHEWAKAGLMVRESLGPGARHAFLMLTARHGIQCLWRPISSGAVDLAFAAREATPKLPITLRLTRHGAAICADYSSDGTNFQPAGQLLQFEPALPRTVYVGLAITAHDASKISEARFSGLQIQKQ